MNITVINIRDLMKYVVALCLLVLIVATRNKSCKRERRIRIYRNSY